MGYHMAGFDVTGVDIEAQPEYPFAFIGGDAIEYVKAYAHEYDVVHASPPCQVHSPVSAYSNRTRRRELVDLLPETRDALEAAGRPYVIENVATRSAALVNPMVLCGAMFGLDVYRHRGFESNVRLVGSDHPPHVRKAMRNGYLPTVERPVMTVTGRNGHHSKAWRQRAADAMGVSWLTALNQVCEAIPPAYTRYVGAQLLHHIGGTR